MTYIIETTSPENLHEWHHLEEVSSLQEAQDAIDSRIFDISTGDLVRIRGDRLYIVDDEYVDVTHFESTENLIWFWTNANAVQLMNGLKEYVAREEVADILMMLVSDVGATDEEVLRLYRANHKVSSGEIIAADAALYDDDAASMAMLCAIAFKNIEEELDVSTCVDLYTFAKYLAFYGHELNMPDEYTVTSKFFALKIRERFTLRRFIQSILRKARAERLASE